MSSAAPRKRLALLTSGEAVFDLLKRPARRAYGARFAYGARDGIGWMLATRGEPRMFPTAMLVLAVARFVRGTTGVLAPGAWCGSGGARGAVVNGALA